jgi:deoxyribodipyrimidine photo-lyase
MSDSLSLVWLRRDLRLYDHAALFSALQQSGFVQPVFIFDTDILKNFPAKNDRRLSFIASTLCAIHRELKQRGGGLLVLHGSAKELLPKLVQALKAQHVFAAEDYEPDARARDALVANKLQGMAQLHCVKDQVVFSPAEILRDGSTPYKVFTPYSRAWRALLTPASSAPYDVKDKQRYADYAQLTKAADIAGIKTLPCDNESEMLAQIGYEYRSDELWPVSDARKRLSHFITHHATSYGQMRDMMAEDGTSRLSPYLRFGLVSARECVAEAIRAGADKWLSELIWREFYAMILYHFPESVGMEWNPKYRGTLNWSHNEILFAAWCDGVTGYPVVDAAMRQLKAEGWMHNRARMVVASFLTKHLRIDWRMGEAHFAQWLMDYDMTSNVGGWQWAASTGTDAQPYFRVFNPILQSKKFDPQGNYIRRYVPELGEVRGDAIHAPWEQNFKLSYPKPIVDHAKARDEALAMFKAVG